MAASEKSFNDECVFAFVFLYCRSAAVYRSAVPGSGRSGGRSMGSGFSGHFLYGIKAAGKDKNTQ